MILEIIKIIPPKLSRNGDTSYTRLEFRDKDGRFYKTDICESYRNHRRWKRVARIGAMISFLRLKMKDDWTIDADSWPIKISRKKDEPKVDLSDPSKLSAYCL